MAKPCPVKQEVHRVASRYGLEVTLVANTRMAVPNEPWIALEVVGDALDEVVQAIRREQSRSSDG